MDAVIVKVLSFVIVIFAGMVASRSGRLGNGTDRVFSKVVFNVTLPAAIIHAFGATSFDPSLLAIVLVGLACTAVPYAASYLRGMGWPRDERVLQQMNVCGFNIGCFGLAFVQAFFPPVCVVATCLFDAGNALMCTGTTYAITKTFVCGEAESGRLRTFVRTLFSSVAFDSYLVLIALGIAGAGVPTPILTLLEPAANANAFLSMFMIGLMVRFSPSGSHAGQLVRLLVWRVVVAALASYLIYSFLPFDVAIRQVLCIVVWSPIGSTGPVFTLWGGGDAGMAGLANAITVLVGVIVMTGLLISMGIVG